MSLLQILAIVYLVGVVLDFTDSVIRFPWFSFLRMVMLAVFWPFVLLLRIWRKVIG